MHEPHEPHGQQQPHLPSPSVWPVTTGAGVSLIAFGIATSLVISALGVVLLAAGVFGWIQELRHG